MKLGYRCGSAKKIEGFQKMTPFVMVSLWNLIESLSYVKGPKIYIKILNYNAYKQIISEYCLKAIILLFALNAAFIHSLAQVTEWI